MGARPTWFLSLGATPLLWLQETVVFARLTTENVIDSIFAAMGGKIVVFSNYLLALGASESHSVFSLSKRGWELNTQSKHRKLSLSQTAESSPQNAF